MKNNKETKLKLTSFFQMFQDTGDLDPMIEWINTTHKKESKEKVETVYSTGTEDIYKMYPSMCPFRGSRLGKITRNKTKISSLIKEHGMEEVKNSIKEYLDDCREHKVYLKNFPTLLNSLEIIKKTVVNKDNEMVTYILNGEMDRRERKNVPTGSIILKNN